MMERVISVEKCVHSKLFLCITNSHLELNNFASEDDKRRRAAFREGFRVMRCGFIVELSSAL